MTRARAWAAESCRWPGPRRGEIGGSYSPIATGVRGRTNASAADACPSDWHLGILPPKEPNKPARLLVQGVRDRLTHRYSNTALYKYTPRHSLQ
eukprot:scaffold2991_cov403-Prasinococcus_capsulatus_cf.AAC.10